MIMFEVLIVVLFVSNDEIVVYVGKNVVWFE